MSYCERFLGSVDFSWGLFFVLEKYCLLRIMKNDYLNMLASLVLPAQILDYFGSVTILGDLTIHANNFATLNKKNFTSATPLKLALNFLILALNDSAFALVSLSSKKLRILS